MVAVSYANFELTNNTRLSFDVRSEENNFRCFFEFSRPIVITAKTLTATLAIISGQSFDQMSVDHALPAQCVDFLSQFCQCQLSVGSAAHSITSEVPNAKCGNIGLSFSGGFDSIAAKELLDPDKTILISLDFGGRFAREAVFFDNFPTLTVRTNLVTEKFHRHSWAFMALGAILASPTLGLDVLSFGSILEASPQNMLSAGPDMDTTNFPVFEFLGLDWYNPALGITEVGSAIIAAQTIPDLLDDSLKSLAEPGTEKLYRKWVLLKLAELFTGLPLQATEPRKPYPQHRLPFGTSFVSHLLSSYMQKKLGAQVRDIFVSQMPDEVNDFIEGADLTFFERYNSNFLQKVPAQFRAGLIARLASFGILPYTQKDWQEYHRTLELLQKYGR